MQRSCLTGGWLYIFLILFGFCGRLLGQDPVMPAIIPSSPQAFELCRAGLISNSLYTGTATLSIPLYNLALKNYSLKVGLQYTSNGVQRYELPSSVGMGFQLLAGGCITRIIHDESDGPPENQPYSSFPDPGNLNSSLLWYLSAAHDYYWDTESDEYLYNFNGMSGRFFVDSSGIGRCIPENNLKIEVDDLLGSKTITITTADGTEYKFGKAETTNTFQVYGSHTYSTSYINETAWFLTEIITQTGEWVHFEYAESNIIINHGPYTVSYNPLYSGSCNGDPCPTGLQSGDNLINHNTYYPIGITSSSGVQIAFVYEQRPDFSSSQDYRLVNMTVRENLTGVLNTIKKYTFKYSFSSGGGTNYRYFLDTLVNESIDGSDLTEKHIFEYCNRSELGSREWDSQWDVFGYPLYSNQNYAVDSTHIDTAATRAYYERNEFLDTLRYPNPTASPTGILTKVTYPTGGYQNFYYEPNIIFDNYAHGVVAGGVRVKSIENYDPLSGTGTKKYYKYTSLEDTLASSGISSFTLFYATQYNYGLACGQTIQQCPSIIVSSNNLTPYSRSGKATMVTYGSVIESDDPDMINGGIQHTYMNEYPPLPGVVYLGTLFTPMPTGTESSLNGAELRTRVFKKKNSGWITLMETTNSFTADYRNQHLQYSYITRRRYQMPYSFNPPWASEFDGYDVIMYRNNSFRYNLTKTVSVTYDEKGLNPVLDSTMYEYEDIVSGLPTKIIRKASDTATMVTRYIYPNQINNGMDIHYRMRTNRNMPGILVESKTYREGDLIAAQKTVFNDNFGGSVVVPEQVQMAMIPDTSNYKTYTRYYAYGPGGSLREMSKEKDIRKCFIYDYSDSVNYDNLPVAEIIGASINDVAYTSFESIGKGEWSFNGTPLINPASVTGSKCYNMISGNITKAINTGKTYIVTFWLKNNTGAVTVNSSSPTLVTSKNGWSLYRSIVSASSSVTISGTGKIDELRLYPQGSLMRTMTYRPFIGTSSECDANNKIIYYDYDAFGRLMLVRDEDKKILILFCQIRKYIDFFTKRLSGGCFAMM